MKINQLEKTANKVNMDLRRSAKALILKIPVPLELTAKGLVAKQSTVDYSGTLQGGLSIDYDAKESESKTSFPLANIKEHQLNYLKLKDQLGGIAFFMIHFKKVYPNEVYITPVKFIDTYWKDAFFKDGRKSIPLKNFKKEWLTTVELYIKKVTEIQDELRFSSF
jgi:recombination protein U